MNMCGERLQRACTKAIEEASEGDVGMVWTNEMGRRQWKGEKQSPDMQWEVSLRDLSGDFFFFFFKSRNPACGLVPWQGGVITPTRQRGTD